MWDYLDDQDQIRQAQTIDVLVASVVSVVQQNTSLLLPFARQKERLLLHSGILCRQFHNEAGEPAILQMVIPKALQAVVFQQLHNNAGHLRKKRTIMKVQERAYWPGYETDVVEQWVKECRQCQREIPLIPSCCTTQDNHSQQVI